MVKRTYRFLDRSAWGDGPWEEEPDKVQYTDEATGLPCLAVRNRMGAWCGYVGVAEGHPLFGVEYSACSRVPPCAGSCDHAPESFLSVHGGITYSEFCQEGGEPLGICHIPEPGEPERVWWLGFDTSHAGDFIPGCPPSPALGVLLAALAGEAGHVETYRTLRYVRDETARLAGQLAAMARAVPT